MGLFDLLFGKSGGSRTLANTSQDKEEQNSKNRGFDPIGALMNTGRYAKTEEEKRDIQEAKRLRSRLNEIRIKKYKDDRLPRYNDNKKRIEVGSDFNISILPDVMYELAQRGRLKNDIGGRFSIKDRKKLQFIVRHKGYVVRKMNQTLNNRNEKYCQVSLKELF